MTNCLLVSQFDFEPHGVVQRENPLSSAGIPLLRGGLGRGDYRAVNLIERLPQIRQRCAEVGEISLRGASASG